MPLGSKLQGIANTIDWLKREQSPKIDQSVSIVIPYYNRPITLKQTLFSILSVDYCLDKLEVLIIDDGSKPELSPKIEEFEDKLDIRCVFQKNLGYRVATARNLGVRVSKHDLVIILDCDLAVSKSFIQDHVTYISQSENVVSIGLRDSYKPFPHTKPQDFLVHEGSKLGVFKAHDWRIEKLEKFPNDQDGNACWRLCSGGNIGFQKSLFYKIGEFDERFVFWGGEDTEWAYRAYKKGAYFGLLPVNAYHFDSHTTEFQVDRYALVDQKNELLSNLVPIYNKNEKEKGEIPYVSVFITHHKKLEYLEECLTSVAASTDYRFEIVIVNDSDCDVEKIVSCLPKELRSNIRLYHNSEHLGAEQSFKKAIELCRGEFIAQLDADDYLLTNAIDQLIYRLNRCDADIAYSKYKVLKDGILTEGWSCREATREMRLLRGMYYHPLRVFRARAIHRVGGFRTLGLEGAVDFSLYSQMELACEAVFCDIFTYVYRHVADSITNTKFASQVDGIRKVIEDNANLLSTTKDYKITQVKERLYDVAFSEQDIVGYDQHFGLKTK